MDSYLETKREDGDRGGHIVLDPSGEKIIASALSLPHTSFQQLRVGVSVTLVPKVPIISRSIGRSVMALSCHRYRNRVSSLAESWNAG